MADEWHGVQLLKPIDGLASLLERAVPQGMFATRMRSVVKHVALGGSYGAPLTMRRTFTSERLV